MAVRLPYCYGNLMHQSRVFGKLKNLKQSVPCVLYQPSLVYSRPYHYSTITSLARPASIMQQSQVLYPSRSQRFPYSSNKSPSENTHKTELADSAKISGTAKPKSSMEKIKIILREYGTVAVVFHTSMSLCILGTCYILVSNGLDVDRVLEYFNIDSSGTKKGASTFAISYLFYKVMLPIRAAITVACVPLIVRKLRSMGWMKGVAKTVNNSTKNKAQ